MSHLQSFLCPAFQMSIDILYCMPLDFALERLASVRFLTRLALHFLRVGEAHNLLNDSKRRFMDAVLLLS